ncbi:MAG: hypothetical protein FWF72_01070 [Paludibacter sp.]|nr:hypothetical protein [Paludibacter sp.]
MENTGGNMDSTDVMSGVSDAVLGFSNRNNVIKTLEDYARSLFFTEDTADMQPFAPGSNSIEYAPTEEWETPF